MEHIVTKSQENDSFIKKVIVIQSLIRRWLVKTVRDDFTKDILLDIINRYK